MRNFKVESTHIRHGNLKIRVATRKETLNLIYDKIKKDFPELFKTLNKAAEFKIVIGDNPEYTFTITKREPIKQIEEIEWNN